MREDKESDLWETPQWLFDKLNEEFVFDIDLTATANNTRVPIYCDDFFGDHPFKYDSNHTGLSRKVTGWINPPYSQSEKFITRAIDLITRRTAYKTIVMLLPVDTSTKWFSLLYDREPKWQARPNVEIRFLQGRLKFTHPRVKATVARFPSMVVILRST